MAEEQPIPRAEQEANMPGAPGYGSAMLAVLVMIVSVGILAALIYLLMITISPPETREGRSRPSTRVPQVQQQAPAKAQPELPPAPPR